MRNNKLICKRCGNQFYDGEHVCPYCGAPAVQPNTMRPAAPGQKRRPAPAASSVTGKTIEIGRFKLSAAQLVTLIVSLIGLLAFIFYFLAPRILKLTDASRAVGFGYFFNNTNYTAFFYAVGAIFTFIAVALVALPVVFQLICKNDEGEFEFQLIPFVLYLIAFITNTVTSGTINRELQGNSSVSLAHVLYIIFSIAFLAFCLFSAFISFKANNNRIKISILGYTVFQK